MVRRADREPVALEAAAEAVLADNHDPYSPPNERRPGARCHWSAGVEHSTLDELLVHLLRVVWRVRRVAIVATAIVATAIVATAIVATAIVATAIVATAIVAGVASFLARRLGYVGAGQRARALPVTYTQRLESDLGGGPPRHRRLLQTMHELEALQVRWTWPTGPTRLSRPP